MVVTVRMQCDVKASITRRLTLILLTWTIWRTPTNASKWRMGFNSAFKALINSSETENQVIRCATNCDLNTGWSDVVSNQVFQEPNSDFSPNNS